MTSVNVLLTIVIGLGGGLMVGCGFVAFLTVLGILPRLMQLTKTMKYIQGYEWAIISGTIVGVWFSLNLVYFPLFPTLIALIGLAHGIFVGMLAAALTEVLNVFPILAKRIGIDDRLAILLMAIVLGKIVGSLFHWMYFTS
ncbi:stage V sporulation protein AB [Priestia filamentosa]|uniref:Stage V sporulation protein AB n=2 Tax=Priestia filamentosa TaxID=1402861 RepID=A0A0H4KNU8_9BACI|nr:stage V sporulation protein AB [Priestia filamentosa]SMF07090.1 stage V sporulation protein AB [Priestia filamentosa]